MSTQHIKSSIRKSTSQHKKTVQFNSQQLETICLFRKAETPLSIHKQRELSFINWDNHELSDIVDMKNKMIRTEEKNIELIDNDYIKGRILVRNLDYHKEVNIRYTFDYWKTVDNTQATYHETRKSHDVFEFKIKSTSNTLYFAVQYKVGSADYWDNNHGKNYEIQIISQQQTTCPITQNPSPVSNKDGLAARYNFGQSINKAKVVAPTPTIRSPSPKTISSPIIHPSRIVQPVVVHAPSRIVQPIPIVHPSRISAYQKPLVYNYQSPPTSTCHSPASTSMADLDSQYYMELLSKYCFYSTSLSPMSING
ncbi:putative phosphatase regulatory subunit-domain-containing protein [Pilobolus umbonatus]|nr:putative phosphatase regulatory subunit-domain-containing protein [Pilobolus umbonatus]